MFIFSIFRSHISFYIIISMINIWKYILIKLEYKKVVFSEIFGLKFIYEIYNYYTILLYNFIDIC